MPRFVLASVAATVAIAAMVVTTGSGGSSLGLLFIVPVLIVLGALGCCVAGIAYVLGLPLTQDARAKAWWAAHAWLSWVIAVVGIVAFVLARLVATPEVWYDDEGFSQVQYNSPPVLLFGGILLLTFGVLWAPRRQLPAEPVWGD